MGRSDIPAILGGEPVRATTLPVVRPELPDLDVFAEDFRRCLETGQVTNGGCHVRAIEERIGEMLGLPNVVATSSGQVALLLMLRAAGIDGGEVVVPSFTFSATPHAVRWCGATPVFSEIADDGSYGLDPLDVERRLTPETRAILAVDCYGVPCAHDALDDLGRRYGLHVLYDSAPAFGARRNELPLGSSGRAQSFSFHSTKPFSTMEGGCVTSRDPEFLSRCATLRNFGQIAGPDCDEPGLNGKMLEVCALIGLAQLASLEDMIFRRNRAVARMRRGLARTPGLVSTPPPEGCTPTWMCLPVQIDAERYGLDRDRLILALAWEGIQVRAYFSLPCHRMRAYGGATDPTLAFTEALASRVLTLPVYSDMTTCECDDVLDALDRIHRHADAVAARLVSPIRARGE